MQRFGVQHRKAADSLTCDSIVLTERSLTRLLSCNKELVAQPELASNATKEAPSTADFRVSLQVKGIVFLVMIKHPCE